MKNKIKITLGVLISIFVIYFVIYFIQNITLKNSFSKELNENFKKNNTSLIRCNINIFKPEFAFVYGGIGFYSSQNLFYQTESEWDKNRIGGTTVENTTFENLLLMVKENCYQFQKTFYQNDDNKLYWTWSKSIKETPEQIEKRRKKKEEIKRQIESGEIKKDTRTLEEVLKDIREREAKEEE